MAFKLDYGRSTLSAGIDGMASKVGAVVMMYASTKATELEAKMKANRPWTDRTGMAKARLNASVSQPSNKTVRITLAHGVDYGIQLELGRGKRYAIIAPTINQEGPHLVSGLNGIMSKL